MLKLIHKLFLCVIILCVQNLSAAGQIDTSGFNDSRHHWYNVYEKNNVIGPLPNRPCYKTTQIKKIADNILLYQRNNGGWPQFFPLKKNTPAILRSTTMLWSA